jgi:thymidylate synthase
VRIAEWNADALFDRVIENLLVFKTNIPGIEGELVNANLVLLDPTRNTMCNCKRKMPIRYAIGELLWYNSRNNTWQAIEPFSKFWKDISDDGEHVNSNYGWCIHDKYDFDQWEYVKQLLKNDPNTRQAIIHIKEPTNKTTKDLNCTISLQFLLRDGKLNLITTMRSNDVWLGLPYDLFNFTCMQIQMAMELGVKIGKYYHNAGSLHLYERDVKKLGDISGE